MSSPLTIHPMWMPDRDQMQADSKYAQYVPLRSTITWYEQLPKTFQGYFDSCGNGDENKGTPPEMPVPTQVRGSDLANFTNYGSTATSLRQAAAEIGDSATAIAPKAKATEAISIAAQKAVNSGIDMITNAAPTLPKPGMKEDQHIYEFCNDAIQSVASAFDEALNANKDTASGIDKEAEKLKELEAQIKKLQQENADLKKKLTDPPTVPEVPTTPPPTPSGTGVDPSQVIPIDDNSKVPGLDDLNTTIPGVDTGTTPTGTSLEDKVGKALNDISSATNPTTGAPVSPNTATPQSVGSGMDMGSLLPLLMSRMNDHGQADTDLNNRRSEYDPYEDQLRAVPAAAAPVQPAVQAATSTPATTTTNTAPPASASSSQPTTGMPGRAPNSDGTVVYTFPDGRTQKVSVTVAQALDAAFGNASGTDAQAAYAKTPAKWSDKKQIGNSVDPYQLMTGDIAVWDGRTAIVVVFPADDGGTLEVVVNGQLKQFTPTEMSDSAGEFGQFVGFNHPHGIEATAPEDHDQSKMSGMPVTGDPSAGAAMPAVAAPA